MLSVRNISKRYRLGEIGAGSLREEFQRLRGRVGRWWRGRAARALGGSAPGEDGPGEIWALRDVSFELGQGEVLGIIGRNGAGKSTLLKVLSRITEPTSGEAILRGRVASLLEVGTGFHPELTGRENVYLSGAILGMRRPEIGRKFAEIVEFSGVGDFIDTPVKRYSSGMQVRLGFAVAAHLEPEILIVDEVLAVGDAVYQKRCLERIEALAKSGITTMFVSHLMPSVARLCSRCILLEAGRVAMDGASDEVISRYLDSGNREGAEWAGTTALELPGKECARLARVRVLQGDKLADHVDMARAMEIEIEYECLREGARLNSCMILKDKTGASIFSTLNLPSAIEGEDRWGYRAHQTGRYRSRVLIPAEFLNEGLYRASVGLMRDASELCDGMEDAVSFVAQDTGSMRGEYHNFWVGSIRPRFSWGTERLGDG